MAVVADGVEPDPLVKAAAYLHDTVEDTGTTIDTIRAEFPQEVAEAVSVLTRKKDMTYAEYIWRVKQNDIAVKVKRADLVSNMDLNRIPYPLTKKTLHEKPYLRAYKMLDGRKTVSAVNPYALYDYLVTCGWESDPSENQTSESPVLKAPFGSYKVLVPLDMQRTDYEQRLRDALETLCFFEVAPMCDILRNALILDASARREQVLSRGTTFSETRKNSRLCCCCFWNVF